MFVIFSILAELTVRIATTHAQTKEIQLIEEKELKFSYIYEEKKHRLLLNFARKSADNDQQRLKIRITDEKGQDLDYPETDQMRVQDGWLIEGNFSAQQEGQVTIDLPQSVKIIQLFVQMDQQSNADHQKGVQENILDYDQPFIINLDNTDKAIDSSSEIIIGPKEEGGKSSANTQAVHTNTLIDKMYERMYTNKQPHYTINAGGEYPEYAWQPENQLNVINHQGGDANKNEWDEVTSWDIATDDYTQSYINYGEDNTNPNISIRKYAQQTDQPDEFKIKLNVKGNTAYEPGVDLVFLLDNSSSMLNFGSGSSLSRKKNTEAAFEKIITKLQETYPDNQGGIRIGSHIFSDYEPGYWGETSNEKMTFPLSASHTDWKSMVTEYCRTISVGSTFTQQGLREAGDIFLDAPNVGERYKMLFLLTDGAPNRSWIPKEAVSDPNMYYDPFHITTFSNMGSMGDYGQGSKLNAVANQTKFPLISGLGSSHITTTNSTAKGLKENEGVEIHTIGVNIEAGTGDHSTAQLKKGLYRMSTKKANTGDEDSQEDYFYYDVSNPDELTEVFKNWYETIIRTVDRGKITDPLGEMVDIVEAADPEATIKLSQVSNGAEEIESKNMPSFNLTDNKRTIDISNINLTGGQEIEIEYTVKLKTTSPSFVSNQWYPANGTTTLEPTPERNTDKLEFGSPSVRYKKLDLVIPVEKIWSDTDKETENYWNLRPRKVTAVLQTLEGSEWEEVETIDLSAATNWKGTFAPVEGGAETTYRVIEPARTTGYKVPSINQDRFTSETLTNEGIKITNELLRGEYQFWKFMGVEKNTFSRDLPEFLVTREDGKLLAEKLKPDSLGSVSLKNVPIGEYTVEETYVPLGFKKMADFVVKVTEDSSAIALIFKVDDHTDPPIVINELKDFSLVIEKIDPMGEPLKGAAFKLTGPNYEESQSGGPEFTFSNLRPGSYTLTETENPDRYQRIKEPILFEIESDGKVTIQPHSQVSGAAEITGEGNRIKLKVVNKKVREGALPNTGAFGIRKFYLAAIFCVILGVILSGVSAYHTNNVKE